MDVEYEATFAHINADQMRLKLENIGGTLKKSEMLQKRKVFFLPHSHDSSAGFVRVRDEGDKVTMTLKVFDGVGIERQKEKEVVVDNFNEASDLLENLGMVVKAYQETKREIWLLDNVEIMIDTWPFLETFVEIEGKSEDDVKKVSERLGLNWEEAIFDTVTVQYCQKYDISAKRVNEETPVIVFDMDNPFLIKDNSIW